jgi:hypothetical protein
MGAFGDMPFASSAVNRSSRSSSDVNVYATWLHSGSCRRTGPQLCGWRDEPDAVVLIVEGDEAQVTAFVHDVCFQDRAVPVPHGLKAAGLEHDGHCHVVELAATGRIRE